MGDNKLEETGLLGQGLVASLDGEARQMKAFGTEGQWDIWGSGTWWVVGQSSWWLGEH